MDTLVFVVEDDSTIKKQLTRLLEENGISFIFASNLKDAIELFEMNKTAISFIALDGNLTGGFKLDSPETLLLAKIISDSVSFNGITFAMSTVDSHNDLLKRTIGERCEVLNTESILSMKLGTIKEIIRRINKNKQAV